MRPFEPSDHLHSRTFIGLLVAQFLAAFNDQAIHASAMFFAINQGILNERDAIGLMPILFYAPWAVFCTLAGYLSDKYSKRSSLIFWKVAEVLITLTALAGFWLGMGPQGSKMGPWLVLSTVFLMGMHSAFFVPAKYGVMPEILTSRMLSRGNGLLESLSFLAIILGTVFGGVLSFQFKGSEYLIGIILVVLAVIGALASFLIRRMPPANPERTFPPFLYGPLIKNIRALLRSRPLAFAVVGIAFFTFIVSFMRATVYMHGQSQIPRWTESHTSELVGMVALGIGLGSPLVGFLSGGKVELGMVPIGAFGMILGTTLAGISLFYTPGLAACIVAIGFFTGFYLVPLFTLLQHRAPPSSKGDSIATSNFINVTGAILASAVFWCMTWAAERTGLVPRINPTHHTSAVELSADPTELYEHGRPKRLVLNGVVTAEADDTNTIDPLPFGLKKGDRVIQITYKIADMTYHRLRKEGDALNPIYDKRELPRFLFYGAAVLTLLTLLVLRLQLRDLFLRTLLWFRWRGRARLEVIGQHHLPDNQAAVLVLEGAGSDTCLQVLSATDRTTRFLLVESTERPVRGLTRLLIRRNSLALLPVGGLPAQDVQKVAQRADREIGRGEIIGLSLSAPTDYGTDEKIFELVSGTMIPVLPVYCETEAAPGGKGAPTVYVVFGEPLPAGATADAVRLAIQKVGEAFHEKRNRGELPSPALTMTH